MSTAPPPAADRPRRRRRPLLIALVVLLVLLLASAVAGGLWVMSVARGVDDGVHRFDAQVFPDESLRPSPVEDGDAMNFLLLGEDAGAEERGDEGRSDSMMWVHVPADRKDVQIVSILRDTYVEIPGHGQHKINAAYQYGGVPLTVATVENLMGTRVDHVAAIDLAGFQGLVDALGGVTVDNEVEFTTTDVEAMHFPVGSIHMDGATALNYSRERHAFPDSDYQRVKNQQNVVIAIVNRFISRDTLSNPGRVKESVDTFAPFLTFDDELGSGTLASLGWSLRDVRSADIQTTTAPTAGGGTLENGQSVIWADEEGMARLGEALRTDTMDEYLATEPAQ